MSKRKTGTEEKATTTHLFYHKNAPDPIALADDEYPDWLWDLLDENKQRAKVENPANRQFHKKANREAIKAANFMSNKKT
ncbi:mitochondrial ribosomal protein L37-domain-containing protein [Jimgerdemannia flammicorona]|uniref:Large ribosomal subunit protein mL54 n=1 Tax=Jimgerdemannia flammicorona TaxID=994334 RepID=A0A433DJF9_9FUNG|nr:mitochondrial ribosomal protein L37-domain-containing protein [Jimgerdemannia flammicorona]